MMFKTESDKIRKLTFSKDGLDLFPMGEIFLGNKSDFRELDISVEQDYIECLTLSFKKSYSKQVLTKFKKTKEDRFLISQISSAPSNIYVGTDPDNKIVNITIIIKQDILKTKKLFEIIYGPYTTEIIGGTNDCSQTSFSWNYADFRILLSDSEIEFYYPPSLEYVKELIRKHTPKF